MPLHICAGCIEVNKSLQGKTVYIPKGRRRIVDVDAVVQLRATGATISAIASRFGVSDSRIFQLLRIHRKRTVSSNPSQSKRDESHLD